jgi:uncharacterized protein YdeI (YjbR/CyaY-like superfamily)
MSQVSQDTDTTPAAAFFATPAALRTWLAAHHETAAELLVGLYKKGSGRPSITWSEAVDQALCFGWIDGKGQNIDADSWAIRFTPRRPKSTWSNVNIAKVAALTEAGLMQPAGLRAFAGRDEAKSGVYSFEQQAQSLELPADMLAQFRAQSAAWDFWEAQPAGYRRAAVWWVISAKQEATRLRRLAKLIEDSAQGQRVAQFTSPARRPGTSTKP